MFKCIICPCTQHVKRFYLKNGGQNEKLRSLLRLRNFYAVKGYDP